MTTIRRLLTFLLLLPLISSADPLISYTNKKSGREIFFKPAAGTVFVAATSPKARASASPTPTIAPDPLSIASNFVSQASLPLAATTLTPERLEKDSLGMTHLRYSQRYRGIRVYGADVMAHLNSEGNPSSVGANISEALRVRTVASITSTRAVSLARSYWENEYGTEYAPVFNGIQRYVYDTSIIKNIPTEQGTRELVYAVRLLSDAPGRSWIYFVSAGSGELVGKEALEFGLDRRVSDCSYSPGSDQCASSVDNPNDEFDYIYGRREGAPPSGPNPRFLPEISADTDELFDLAGQLHGYLESVFGLDGANRQGGLGAGGSAPGSQLITVTRIQSYLDFVSSWIGLCPYAQFHTNGLVQFCRGAVASDLFAHEYAHGIQFFSQLESGIPVGMVYEGESAALMENHGDVFGESFENFLTGRNDWTLFVGSTMRSRRDVSNPSIGRDSTVNPLTPDRSYSSDFYCGSDEALRRYGNMQVLNKAFYLASEGGWFNGCSISQGIGIEKAIQIWTRAVTTYYSRIETFNGANYKLQQSCADLYAGENSMECNTLRAALQSVELDQAGRCSGQPQTLPGCVDITI